MKNLFSNFLRLYLPAMLAAAACAPLSHAADAWPTKPITLVVPFDAGASIDLIMRFYAERLGKALGERVIVENAGGAGGAIGMAKALRGAPDGYTLLGTPVTVVAAIPYQQKLSFDPLKEFVPIARIAETVPMFGVPVGLGINTLQQFIDAAKKAPGTLNYASAGVGSILHVRFEALEEAANIDLIHVPYKGGSGWVADFRSGRINLVGDGTIVAQMAKEGTAKPLAVVDSIRSPAFPDVPTVNEILPKYKSPPGWNLFLAPAGTPKAVTDRIALELKKIAALPETREQLGKSMVRPLIDPPGTDLNKMLVETSSYYADMSKRLNLMPK